MSFQLQFVFALFLMSLILINCDDSSEEPVEMMTTQEPIDTADDLKLNNSGVIFTTSVPVNCSMISSCDSCSKNNCSWETCYDTLDSYSQCSNAVNQNCTVSSCEHDTCKNVSDCEQCGKIDSCNWVQCTGSDEGPFCGQVAEMCSPVECNATAHTTTANPNDNITTVTPIDTTTVNPNDTTTTTAPPETTTTSPNTTTTSSPDTTTSSPDTTTSSPDTTTSSPDTTTSSPSPDTTTSSPSPDTTTTAPPTTTPGPAPTPSPQSGGFSAGSFFGGITLTLALLGVGLGGYKFYRTRYDVNYRTL